MKQTRPTKDYFENVLTPVNLTGTVVPCINTLCGGNESEFKLVCSSGLEYFFVADLEWKGVLSRYSWENVSVVALLNISNMTLLPQKVFPKGPRGDAPTAGCCRLIQPEILCTIWR